MLRKGAVMQKAAKTVLTLLALTGVGALSFVPMVWGASSDRPAEWASLRVAELADLAHGMAEDGNTPLEQFQRLAAHLGERYVSDKPQGREAWAPWLDLADVLGPQYSEQIRKAMVQDLRSALVPDRARVVALPGETLVNVVSALARLGAAVEACDVEVIWIAGSDKHADLSWQQIDRATSVFLAAGEAGEQARTQLAEFISSTYLSSSASVRRLPCSHWRAYARSLRPTLSEADRAAWAERLRAAYAPTEDRLVQLDGRQVIHLARALGDHLNDRYVPALVATYVQRSDGWKPLATGANLGFLAQQTHRAGETGQPAERRLIEYVESQYLSGAEAVRSLLPGEWRAVADGLVETLSNEQQARWATALKGAYAEDREILAALDIWATESLARALDDLGEAETAPVFLTWMDVANWRATGPDDLARLAHHLARMGETGREARRDMAALLEHRYLTDAASVRQVSPQHWVWLTGHLRGDLSQAQKARWADAVQKVYAAPKTLATLDVWAVEHLHHALSNLEAKDPFRVFPAWMDVAEWRGMAPDGLAKLAHYLTEAGDAGQAGRRALAGHVEERYLADAASVRQVTPKQWDWLTKHLTVDLSQQQRSKWVEALQETFVEDAKALRTLDIWTVQSLKKALDRLGMPETSRLFLSWMQAAEWQKGNPDDLARLAHHLARMDEAGKAGRQAMARHLEGQYVSDVASARSVSPQHWDWLTDHLVGDLSAAQRTTWATALTTAYVTDAEQMKALTLREVGNLETVFARLGVEGKALHVAPRWMAVAAWKELEPRGLVDLARRLAAAEAAGKPGRRELAGHVRMRLLSGEKAAASVDLGGWRALARSLATDVPEADRAAWIRGLRTAITRHVAADGALDGGAVDNLKDSLKVLGQETPALALLGWMQATEWRGLTPDGLAKLAQHLVALEETGQAGRQAMAAHVQVRYLADSGSVRQVSPQHWDWLTGHLAEGLSETRRTTWATALTTAYVTDAEMLKGLTLRETGNLQGALDRLAVEGKALRVAPRWMAVAAWKDLEPRGLVDLARRLAAAEAAGKPGRRELAGHVRERLVADEASVQTLDLGGWLTLAGSLAGEVPAGDRTAWVRGLRAAVARHVEVDGTLNGEAVDNLKDSLAALGEKTPALMLLGWVQASEWRGLTPDGLAKLAQHLVALEETGQAGRQAMAAHVQARYLTDSGSVRQVSPQHWDWLSGHLAEGLSDGQQRRWAEALTTAYVTDAKALGVLDIWALGSLRAALGRLGVEETSGLVLDWMPLADWREAGPGGLARLADYLDQADEAGKAARRELIEHLETTYLADGASVQRLSPRHWGRLADHLAEDLSAEDRTVWISRIRSAHAGDAESLRILTSHDLRDVVEALKSLGDRKTSVLVARWITRR